MSEANTGAAQPLEVEVVPNPPTMVSRFGFYQINHPPVIEELSYWKHPRLGIVVAAIIPSMMHGIERIFSDHGFEQIGPSVMRESGNRLPIGRIFSDQDQGYEEYPLSSSSIEILRSTVRGPYAWRVADSSFIEGEQLEPMPGPPSMQEQQLPGHDGSRCSIMLFISEMWSKVMGVKDTTRGVLFLGINGVEIHQLVLVNSVALEKRDLVKFEEAFDMSFPLMVHISMICLCFGLNCVLLSRVYLAVQCVLIILCILMPLYYFAELAHKASGIAVNFGSFEMPLIWFSTLGGLGISLICGSVVLLMVFVSWLYARRRGLEFQGISVTGDGIIGAMNA